tara:strand:+ start:589 stop:777 length:189 start_codon:yes stop_codon:yes gene_type:complete
LANFHQNFSVWYADFGTFSAMKAYQKKKVAQRSARSWEENSSTDLSQDYLMIVFSLLKQEKN